ncbi:hypothetical protein DMUE_1289 [Dictyocoela muelleri]|nr:hypothetical protein DMUE_1289 [Dictyocoela muelleri]
MMVDGRTIKSNRCTKFWLSIPGVQETFLAVANILKYMNTDLILGINFLYKHDIQIDLRSNHIIIYGHKIPLLNNRDTEEFIDKLLSKLTYTTATSINTSPKINEFFSDLGFEEITLGRFNVFQHKIQLKENKIVRKNLYKVPTHLITPRKNEIEKLLRLGHFKKSKSDFSSPAFLILKKNNDIRLVVDYHELNNIPEPEHFIFPRL